MSDQSKFLRISKQAKTALAEQMPLSYLDTDGMLAADSDSKVPSQKAAKTYIDSPWKPAGASWVNYTEPKADGDFDIVNNTIKTTVDVPMLTPVCFSGTGTMPGGIALGAAYYAIRVDASHIRLGATVQAAYDVYNGVSGVSPVDITSLGSGQRILVFLNRVITSGDCRETYSPGYRIKLTQDAAVKYFYLLGMTYLDGNTILTLSYDSSYKLSVNGIAGVYYSWFANPPGFPLRRHWVSAYKGFSTPPPGTVKNYQIAIDGICRFFVYDTAAYTGISNAADYKLTLPVYAHGGSSAVYPYCAVIDNGVTQLDLGYCGVGLFECTVIKNQQLAGFAISGNKGARVHGECYIS